MTTIILFMDCASLPTPVDLGFRRVLVSAARHRKTLRRGAGDILPRPGNQKSWVNQRRVGTALSFHWH
jgi:hypothetical protein